MGQTTRYGNVDMDEVLDSLLETLDQMRDELPQSGDVLDFLLDFFSYLDQRQICLHIAYEGGGSSRYSQLAQRLTELACWDPESPAGEAYQEMLSLVQQVLQPESVPDMEVQQRLERAQELLTLLQFYRSSQPYEFERALHYYLAETVEKIRDQMQGKVQTLKGELEHTKNQLRMEKARNDQLQRELKLVLSELKRSRK